LKRLNVFAPESALVLAVKDGGYEASF
jgi:hypothetical protein